MRIVWFFAQLAAVYGIIAWAFHLGRASAAPSGVDVALGVLWRLVPLAAVVGLLVYAGGLLWLDYCRRTWAARRD